MRGTRVERMRQLVSYLKIRYRWLSEPAGHNEILLMRLADSVAKWVVGVGGVVLTVSISFSASAYTSFIQVSERCQARLIASDAILAGRVFGWGAVFGAVFALLGLAWPHVLKQLWYNPRSQKSRKHNSPAPNLVSWHPTALSANIHVALIVIGICIVTAVPLATLSILARQTPDGLARYVQTIDAKCFIK